MRCRIRRMLVLALAVGMSAGMAACSSAARAATADKVRMDVALGTPVVLAGGPQRAFLKVALTGFPLEAGARRTPVNVSIVLDRSGSMSGEKIRKAREAAIMAIDRLGPDDIVSLVAYNHTVQVLVPATKVRDRNEIYRRIRRIMADGNTALFAGVSKGSHEVRKFMERNRVNRVILLSDGLANVGPSSPGDLADLGRSLIEEGISVTTIGLGQGYNEDLMVQLARASDGNHAFARTASDLARIFGFEFGDVLSVVAKEVEIHIRCAPGVRPIRVLGRRADINGQEIVTSMNQLYANQEKYLMVEVEVPEDREGRRREVASVKASYANTVSKRQDELSGQAMVSYTRSPTVVEKRLNKPVIVSSVEMVANEANLEAVKLRDAGKKKEARKVLKDNVKFLQKKAKAYKSDRLGKLGDANIDDMKNIEDEESWNVQRKTMRKRQYQFESQQAW